MQAVPAVFMVDIVNKDSMTVPDSQGFIGHKHTSEWPTLIYFNIEGGGGPGTKI